MKKANLLMATIALTTTFFGGACEYYNVPKEKLKSATEHADAGNRAENNTDGDDTIVPAGNTEDPEAPLASLAGAWMAEEYSVYWQNAQGGMTEDFLKAPYNWQIGLIIAEDGKALMNVRGPDGIDHPAPGTIAIKGNQLMLNNAGYPFDYTLDGDTMIWTDVFVTEDMQVVKAVWKRTTL